MIKAEVTLELDTSSLERILILANEKGKTVQEMAVSLLEKGIDMADSHEIHKDQEKSVKD